MTKKYYVLDDKYYTKDISRSQVMDVPHVGRVVVHPVTEENVYSMIDLESYLHWGCIEKMKNIFSLGHTFNVTFFDGGTAKVRTFMANGDLCFFKGRATTRGYSIHDYPRIEGGKFASVSVIPTPPGIDAYASDLARFRHAFLNRCHKNLWVNLQKGYKSLDIEKFREFFDSGNYEDSRYGAYLALREWNGVNSENIICENRYKTTTIRANRPRNGWKYRSHMRGDYDTCIENISRHLDNKEDFHYSWRSNYDVTVSGRMCNDGVYRAWLSLEYYDCGNGHYYALINENSAVFLEKD